MKTVGQLLQAERIKKEISIEELSRSTKIDTKYIKALEDNRYDLLPSETFTKGFVRNLSLSLCCNPDEYVAVFRRDYKNPHLYKNFPSKKRLSIRTLVRPSSQVVSLIIIAVVFLVYLGFQFRAILIPPPLSVNSPRKNLVTVSPVTIEGTTSTDSLVTINGDSVVKPDANGYFQVLINLPVGDTSLTIKATNRFSRTNTVSIPIIIISN